MYPITNRQHVQQTCMHLPMSLICDRHHMYPLANRTDTIVLFMCSSHAVLLFSIDCVRITVLAQKRCHLAKNHSCTQIVMNCPAVRQDICMACVQTSVKLTCLLLLQLIMISVESMKWLLHPVGSLHHHADSGERGDIFASQHHCPSFVDETCFESQKITSTRC